MDVGAVKAPTIRRSQTCKRSRQSVSTSPSRFFKVEKCRASSGAAAIHQHGHRAARHVLSWSGLEAHEGQAAHASIQNNSGLPQGLAGWSAIRLSVR
jgi:hypothetical protein